MAKVIIEMSMSLDGFCAGPDDGEESPDGRDSIKHVFGWLSRAKEEGGANKAEVDRMCAQSGAYIFGRRTYDITNGWGGSHPLRGVPLFILTHKPPAPETVPRGDSKITFVTNGIESAVSQAKSAAGDKDVVISGASGAVTLFLR